VARDRHDSGAIGHDDVLALASDPESSFLEGANRVEVIDPGNLWQG